ncbi:hypothetical protein [Rubritalea tangerina]
MRKNFPTPNHHTEDKNPTEACIQRLIHNLFTKDVLMTLPSRF